LFIYTVYLSELYCREKLVDGKGKEKDEAAEKKEKSERKNLCLHLLMYVLVLQNVLEVIRNIFSSVLLLRLTNTRDFTKIISPLFNVWPAASED